MTFDKWIEKEGVGSDAIELKLKRAWDAAKADCQEEIARLEVKAQRNFDDWLDEKEKTAKYLKALDDILNVLASTLNDKMAAIFEITKKALKEGKA